MEWKSLSWSILTTLFSLQVALYLVLRQIFHIQFPDNQGHDPLATYTVRVNTFRRNDLLENFLEHYTTCPEIETIQVIWSDQENKVPKDLQKKYASSKVFYEIHSTDRLSNRFNPLTTTPTDAILSIDDDLLVPCPVLARAHQVWLSNQRTLVGFAPRMNAYDARTDQDRYLRWQHTWWNGIYSIVLTKACFLHRRYLDEYFKVIPAKLIEEMDRDRNCEDIAMAYVVAKLSQSPPVWVKGIVYEEADSGISAGSSHFQDRSICLGKLQDHRIKTDTVWVTGYQKALSLSFFSDWGSLFAGRNMESATL